ncbi:hypothetical protein EV199_1744 [Pseudobacter ginsenosidimutans]|uniref:Uncharacterized protein n=1 Tax=Pseudobacter ginsenosidimutans TaxID=661488 RepID=A0A4Q7N4E4_9BACT|nr:hypothetical protein EV199_1744 [Pseudobacter ginsenosidimutans]
MKSQNNEKATLKLVWLLLDKIFLDCVNQRD